MYKLCIQSAAQSMVKVSGGGGGGEAGGGGCTHEPTKSVLTSPPSMVVAVATYPHPVQGHRAH